MKAGSEDISIKDLNIIDEKTRKYFLAGYFVRIFTGIMPFLDSIGYLVTGIAWIKVKIRGRKLRIYLITGMVLAILFMISLYVNYYQLASWQQTLSPLGVTSGEARLSDLVDMAKATVDSLRDNLILSYNIVVGIVIAIEALALRYLSRGIGFGLSRILWIIFVLLAIVQIIISPISLLVAGNIEGYIDKINQVIAENGDKVLTAEEYTHYMMEFAFTTLPITIASIPLFVLKLLAYIWAVLGFRKIGKELATRRKLMETLKST